MPQPLCVTFVAGLAGPWRIDRLDGVVGESLPSAARLSIHEGADAGGSRDRLWSLRGVASNARYTRRAELDALGAKQEPLRRPQATCAALIPIRKNSAWWDLAQDERRAVFEEQSRHIAIGLDYLPGVARRLHHCRDLGQPFDFLTWFEYAPENIAAFEEMVQKLRATPEWRFVEREIDIRLTRVLS